MGDFDPKPTKVIDSWCPLAFIFIFFVNFNSFVCVSGGWVIITGTDKG